LSIAGRQSQPGSCPSSSPNAPCREVPSARRGWAPRLVLGVAGAASLVGLPRAARADNKFVDLHADAIAGAILGGGSGTATTASNGTSKKLQTDFFESVRGPAAGVEVGMRLLILDLSARFLQVFDGGGRQGTFSQLALSFVLGIPIGRGGVDELGRALPGTTFLRPAASVGFGIGTLGPVSPPLNNEQIAQKGLVTGGAVGVEHVFGRFFSLEGRLEGGYHYFFGAQTAINSQSASSGWQMAALGLATFHLGI